MDERSVNEILNEAQKLVSGEYWKVMARTKNAEFRATYVVSARDAKRIVQKLTVADSYQLQNCNDLNIKASELYVFGSKAEFKNRLTDKYEAVELYIKFAFIDSRKKLLIVSLHKAEHPII